MDARLLSILEKALVSGEIGSLFIGQGRKMRQVFFAGNEVYLVEAGREIRFCPLPFVLDGSVVPQSELDIVLGRFSSSPKSLAMLLDEDYEPTEAQKSELRRTETLEEALMVLEAGTDRFVFEAGTVPEEVLLPEAETPVAIPNQEFLAALRLRVRERELIDRIFPHPEEMPVLTPEGSSQRQSQKQWLFGRVAELVDGFRDLRRIRKDSLLFPHLTEKLLAAAVRRNWARKKRFPEFEGIRLEKLDAEQLATLVKSLEEAIGMAVDEVPLRKILVTVLERRGDLGALLAQQLRIGDIHAGRRDRDAALECYRRAVKLAPRSSEACGRLARVLEECADEALAAGDAEGARQHLEEALPLRPHDESIHLRIVRSHGDDDQAAARAAARLAGMLHQDDQGERALRFLRLVLQAYATSDVVRKTFINFLLDHGMAEQALHELEMLAREFLVRGHTQDARQIFEKILRIDPDRVPKELRAKLRARPVRPVPVASRQRARRRRPVAMAMFLAVVAVFGYQAWLWQRAGVIERRAHAILAEPVPQVGTHEHVALRARWQEVLGEIERIRQEHPVQVATLRFGSDLDQWITTVSSLEHDAETYLADLVARAHRAELQGSVAEARGIYQELARVSGDPRWSALAREKLAELEGVHGAAVALRERADAARREGDRVAAFRLLRELVDRYPSAEASSGVRLPVRIATEPPGAEIEIGGVVAGTAPLIVELIPYTEVEIRAYLDGYPERAVEIDDPREPEIEIDLRPAPSSASADAALKRRSRAREWAPFWLVIPSSVAPPR